MDKRKKNPGEGKLSSLLLKPVSDISTASVRGAMFFAGFDSILERVRQTD